MVAGRFIAGRESKCFGRSKRIYVRSSFLLKDNRKYKMKERVIEILARIFPFRRMEASNSVLT